MPLFMMLTIVSMIVSSPALLPPAALSESNSDARAVENTELGRGGERLFSTGSIVRRGIENRQSRFRDLRWR